MEPRDDIQSEPFPNADIILFVDGSCYKGDRGHLAGYAVVCYNFKTDHFDSMILQHVSQPCSVQLKELKPLAAACHLGLEKYVIFTMTLHIHMVSVTCMVQFECKGVLLMQME